jgi:hypothetical protein
MKTNYQPIVLTILLFFLSSALSAPIFAPPGHLDLKSSRDGKLTDWWSRGDSLGVAIQPDGKIGVAESGSSTKNSAIEVTRTNYGFLPLGGVTGGAVNAIAISGSNVYVGGTFNAAGDISANYIA